MPLERLEYDPEGIQSQFRRIEDAYQYAFQIGKYLMSVPSKFCLEHYFLEYENINPELVKIIEHSSTCLNEKIKAQMALCVMASKLSVRFRSAPSSV